MILQSRCAESQTSESLFGIEINLSKDFLLKLKDHLLRRILGTEEEDFTADDHCTIFISRNQLYLHNTLRINYTTYNCRRDQDSINPRTTSDIMTLSERPNSDHPYLYGRIIKIFHVVVQHMGPQSMSTAYKQMDVLWVRWYALDEEFCAKFFAKRLHRVGFIDTDTDAAFGFLEPERVIRAVHLLPVFFLGQTGGILPATSLARRDNEEGLDYHRYYVNM